MFSLVILNILSIQTVQMFLDLHHMLVLIHKPYEMWSITQPVLTLTVSSVTKYTVYPVNMDEDV